MSRVAVAILVLAAVSLARPATASRIQDEEDYTLPQDLLIGAGTSAFQTEGAVYEDGKAESAVDALLKSDKLVAWGLSDILDEHGMAADSYHRFMDDVKAAASLKLQLYRFSISWARLMPTANVTEVNPKAVEYYNQLIKEITDHNMTPMVTLHHFDHPQILEEHGGWQDKERRIVGKFKEYATVAFNLFKHKVRLWTTINEPNMYCVYFPALAVLAGSQNKTDEYECVHNTVLAHMEAYQVFLTDVKPSYPDAMLGFTAKLMPAAPNSTEEPDVFLAEAFNQMHAGNVLHPVIFGDYPPLYKQLVHTQPLPIFTPEEKRKLKGSSDFLGLNVYYGLKVGYRDPSDTSPVMTIPGVGMVTQELKNMTITLDVHGNSSNMMAGYTSVEPQVMKRALLWTWENYHTPIIITENGYGDVKGLGLHDHQRAVYHSAILRSLASTVNKYSIKVLGYCVWSLVDAYEWSGGFKRPFGLVHVDYEGASLNRSLKDSSSFFLELAKGEPRVVPLISDGATARGQATTVSVLFSVAVLMKNLISI